ncbi:MAG: hypothetical protein M0042_03900 [Nitrospiraceae bacterium]|nr:hypothetical protein [Nitrospiraceae bacterium]
MSYRPSYRKMREERENARKAAGLVGERYPSVTSINLHLTYYHRLSGPTVMTRTMNFYAGTCAFFQIACVQDDCSGGGYDLAAVVDNMVKARLATEKGRIGCRGSGKILGSNHAAIAYKVTIEYQKPV